VEVWRIFTELLKVFPPVDKFQPALLLMVNEEIPLKILPFNSTLVQFALSVLLNVVPENVEVVPVKFNIPLETVPLLQLAIPEAFSVNPI